MAPSPPHPKLRTPDNPTNPTGASNEATPGTHTQASQEPVPAWRAPPADEEPADAALNGQFRPGPAGAISELIDAVTQPVDTDCGWLPVPHLEQQLTPLAAVPQPAAAGPPGSSARFVVLTPAQHAAMERKRRAALAKREESERSKRSRVARVLDFDAHPAPAAQQPLPVHHPEALTQQQLARADANRAHALERRQQRLELELRQYFENTLAVAWESYWQRLGEAGQAAFAQRRAVLEEQALKLFQAKHEHEKEVAAHQAAALAAARPPPPPAAASHPALTPAQLEAVEQQRRAAEERGRVRVQARAREFVAGVLERVPGAARKLHLVNIGWEPTAVATSNPQQQQQQPQQPQQPPQQQQQQPAGGPQPPLSPEQRQLMEANRQAALLRRQQREQGGGGGAAGFQRQ